MTLVVEACFDCNGTEYLSSLCNRFRDEHKICNSRSQDVNFSCCCLRNASSSMIVYSTSKIKKNRSNFIESLTDGRDFEEVI